MAKKDFTTPLTLNGDYPSLDDRYTNNGNPYVSKSAAETVLASKLNAYYIGLTVLVKEGGWTEAKEYWVQPKGTTPETYGLVEKGAGTTDYNDLENKPTIGDGTNTNLPIVDNVKVSASTASGETAGVTVTPGQNTGEIEMQFTLPKGADGAPGHSPCLGRFTSIPSPMPTALIGDYLYVDKNTTDPTTQEETTTTTVYHYGANGWDTGTQLDAEHPTLASGQSVESVAIDNTGLANPADNALAKAGDIKAIVGEDDLADLDLSDDNGKVIMRLVGGHVKTKNFDSAKVSEVGDTASVFDIADDNGNVIMRIDSQGHVLTYGFDSRRVAIKDAVNSVSDSIAAFVGKMNEYAANFGMANTNFLNASGQNQTGHYSTAKDIMRMCACCTAYEKLMRYWGLETLTFHVDGDNARDITVDSSYKGSAMTSVGNYYRIYGGKSGTWNVGGSVGTVRNLTLVVKSNIDDAWLVGCVIKTSDSDRGKAFKQLIDWLEAYRQDQTTPAPTIGADYAAAGIIQPHNPMAYADVDYCLVAKSGDTQYLPASMTKLMTAMVALDYCSLDETLTIIASDIQSGSGSTFYAGDKISIADAIPAMLLPSSNTLAVALSRYVGNKIINIKNK